MRNSFSKLNICALILAATLLATPAFANVVSGTVPGDWTPSTFRLYDVSTVSAIGEGSTVYALGYTIAHDVVWSDMDNIAPTHKSGDIAVMILDRELNAGTVSHEGYYTVKDVVLNGPSQTVEWSSVYAVPRPTATTGTTGEVVLSWNPAVDEGTGNIIGYNVYRSTDGINFGASPINSSMITGTSTSDVTATPGGTYYYATKIVFRGTTEATPLESVLSANSDQVIVGTPGVSIISVQPYYAVQGEQNVTLTIIGENTNFLTGNSTVSFEGVNHIGVGTPTVISPTELMVTVDVSIEAEIGPRNVVVRTTLPGPTTEIAVGSNMFWVIPITPEATLIFNPPRAVRGATFDLSITGFDTNFSETVTFPYFGPDITVNWITIQSSTSAVANVTIDPNAVLGTRVMMMYTPPELAVGDFEVLDSQSEDGFIPNYPNPFDPQVEPTHIVIELEQATNVGIYVYDVTARQVWKRVVYLPAGYNEVIWDGYTYFSKIGDNGVYLLRVIDEDSREFIGKGKPLIIKR